MGNFVVINIRDEKEIKKCRENPFFKQSVILPHYVEGYVCYSSSCKNYSFEELIKMFFQGNEDEQIGAVSIVAENYPCELYQFICHQKNKIPYEKLRFIFDCVIPGYLPLVLPKEGLMDYKFNSEFSNNTWVKMLEEIRVLLKNVR